MTTLNTYWNNHLRVAFEQSAALTLPAMVEASLAHVVMLVRTGAMAESRASQLANGLTRLWELWGRGMRTPSFDGTVEDPYYYFEQSLAAELGIERADLDVQLARSRNDLDAAVYRMILRRMLLTQAEGLHQLIGITLSQAKRFSSALIIGMTHRRPAQPTTIGHVLSGLADAWCEQLSQMLEVFDCLNVSPLGSAAFAGTDIPYDEGLVSDLLGFSSVYNSSYEAVAGAEHLMRFAALEAQIGATSARWSRVIQEWMANCWIKTPEEFTQGSSIMPQKVNPVVCEHLASMAGSTLGDMQALHCNITQSWYEDSNNATTDVQQHLWRMADRSERIIALQTGLMSALEVDGLPVPTEIVSLGTTTTAVAEALSTLGVPWRAAHAVVHSLAKNSSPLNWTSELVAEALADAKLGGLPVEPVLWAAQHPQLVLERDQPGGPGVQALGMALTRTRNRTAGIMAALDLRRHQLAHARTRLIAKAQELIPDHRQ